MKQDAWSPRRAIETQYQRAMKKLLRCLVNLVEGLELSSPEAIMTELQRYVKLDFFQVLAKSAASKMATMLRVDGAKTWREAARKSSRGRMINEALRSEMKGLVGARVNQIVTENAQLITTLPENMTEQVTNWTKEQAQKGVRSSEMAKHLMRQFPDMAQYQIERIARTETSKASTALTQARAENMGLSWYVWRTSKDARVRPSHNRMNGVVIAWNDPPNPEKLNGEERDYGPYQAGAIFNCRCFCQPLIDFSQVQWPAKVHQAGTVKSMTLSKFQEIGGEALRRVA